MTRHLDPELVRELLEGGLATAEEAALYAHLRQGDCAECEQGLEALDPADEQRLWQVLSRIERAGPALAGVRQAVVRAAGKQRRLFGPAVLAPVLAAALVLAVVWLWPASDPISTDGSRAKGQAGDRLSEVELTVGATSRNHAGQTRVARVRSGQTVRADQDLVFQVTFSGPCWLYLVRLDPAGGEVLLPVSLDEQAQAPQGSHTPQRDGRPLGKGLAGLSGEQTLVAFCSRRVLHERERIVRLARAAAVGEASQDADAISWDLVRLTVVGRGDSR